MKMHEMLERKGKGEEGSFKKEFLLLERMDLRPSCAGRKKK